LLSTTDPTTRSRIFPYTTLFRSRLYVGNLPFDATEKQIRSFVEGEGRMVTSIKIVTDRDTGRSRGFAFVDVENADQAQQAISQRSEEHTSELQSPDHLVCRLLLE